MAAGLERVVRGRDIENVDGWDWRCPALARDTLLLVDDLLRTTDRCIVSADHFLDLPLWARVVVKKHPLTFLELAHRRLFLQRFCRS